MSQANVESLKRGLAAYDSRDVEALLNELDADVEWQSALGEGLAGETTVYRGHQGVRDLFEEVDHAFTEFRVGLEEFRDFGDRILVIGWMRARGRASGVETWRRSLPSASSPISGTARRPDFAASWTRATPSKPLG